MVLMVLMRLPPSGRVLREIVRIFSAYIILFNIFVAKY
jgi:hypothetical protein